MAQGGPVVDAPSNILNQYRSVRVAWLTTAALYANRLFGILALIEFAWTGLILVLEKTDLQGWTAALIRRMMFVGAFFALLQFGGTWIPAIIDSFVIVGQTASGVPGLSPSGILGRGLEITGRLLVGAAESGWLAAFGTALCMVFAALLSFLAFLGLSIQFVVATIESYLVIGAGFLFLGFGGSRWTAPYVERYIAYAVATGVKIMLIYLLIGAGFSLSSAWTLAAQNIATSTQPATDSLDIAAAAVILLMICWNAPKLAAAMLGGAPTLTGGDAVGTGGAILGGAVAMAGLATAGVALGAKVFAARGGGMAVSQAASVGSAASVSGGGGGNGSLPPQNGLLGSGGGGGGGGGQPSPPISGGGGVAVSPPPSGGRSGSSSPSQSSSGSEPEPASSGKEATPIVVGAEGANRVTAAGRAVAPPSKNPRGADSGKAQRRADTARGIATSTVLGGQAINQLRHAIPNDAAPPTPPPPLNTGGGDS